MSFEELYQSMPQGVRDAVEYSNYINPAYSAFKIGSAMGDYANSYREARAQRMREAEVRAMERIMDLQRQQMIADNMRFNQMNRANERAWSGESYNRGLENSVSDAEIQNNLNNLYYTNYSPRIADEGFKVYRR